MADHTPLQPSVILGLVYAGLNAFMLAAMILFAKLFSPYFGPIEVTFWRNLLSLIALIAWVIMARKIYMLQTDRPWAHLFRGAIGTTGIVFGMAATSLLPLAETTILLFTSPLFVVILSFFILKEKVGIHRFGAVIIGFIGVIIAINPGFNENDLPVLGLVLGLTWGFLAGCVDVCLRWMGKTENSTATVFYFMLFGTLATGLHWPWAEIQPDSFSMNSILIMIGLSATGVLSLLFKTQGFRLAEASTLAPVMYTMLIWTMVFDYAFWGKHPTWNIICGAILIIAAQMYILHREYKIKKKFA